VNLGRIVHAASPAAEFSTELFEDFDVARFTRSRLAVSFHYIIQIFDKFQDITPTARLATAPS
jgi:hypothetical protein